MTQSIVEFKMGVLEKELRVLSQKKEDFLSQQHHSVLKCHN